MSFKNQKPRTSATPVGERINKVLAARGVASRREADALIAASQVLVNGVPATLGQRVSDTDVIDVRGAPTVKRYFLYHKPRGVLTHSPAAGETDIETELLKTHQLRGLAPLGRLDKDSDGLLLLSDDGRLTGPLLDPAAGHEKEYDVTVDKPINHWFLKHMAAGVDIEGYQTKPTTVTPNKRDTTRFRIVLTEGKKHQIRRMCAALGYQVVSLTRIRILFLTIDGLTAGAIRPLTAAEVTKLLKILTISESR